MKKFKHIFGCVTGIGGLVAGYFEHTYLLIILSLITCVVCWTCVDFVRTSIDGFTKRIMVFCVSYLISSFVAEKLGVSRQIVMWMLCDLAFLIFNINSLIIVLDKGKRY